MNFNTMSAAELKDLKRQVEAAIHAKVEERRHEIEAALSKLAHFEFAEPLVSSLRPAKNDSEVTSLNIPEIA
jgi:hypothetical protein